MPDKTVDDLAESIRQMKSEIRDLKGQLAINKLGNQTIYQAMANQTLESPTINDPASTGDATWAGSATFDNGLAVDGGDVIVHDSGGVTAASVTFDNGTANPSTITKTAGADEVVFSNDIVVLTGKFASSTVVIGATTLSESGGLIVSNGGYASTGGGYRVSGAGNNFLQQGAADGGSGEGLSYLDFGGDERMAIIFPGSDIVALGNQVENGIVKIQANTATAGAGGVTDVVTFEDTVVKFKAVEVDFANGTTYKVEADGDAVFKDIFTSGGSYYNRADNSGVYSGASDDIRMYHGGGISYIVSPAPIIYRSTGGYARFQSTHSQVELFSTTYIQLAAPSGQPIYFDAGGAINFRDVDDSSVTLMALDTSARTLAIGGAADPLVTKLGDGGTTNYANFAADGTLTLLGTAKVTKRVELANSILERGATAPTLTYIDNFVGWAYSINDDSVLTWLVPDDWDSSVGIIVEASWYINEAFTVHKEVRFECAYSCVPHDESELIDAPTHTGTLTGPSQNIPTLAKELTTTHIGTIPAGSITAGDEIGLTFKRIAADQDDPTAEPVVIHLELEYTANKLGT